MSLLKSLTGLAKATVQLAKEDKEFRKEAAIAVATLPIFTAQVTISAIDVAVGATKNVAKTVGKIENAMFENAVESLYDNVKVSPDVENDTVKL